MTKKVLNFGAVLMLLPLIFVRVNRGADPAGKVAAPAWKLRDVDGKFVSSDDLKGKVIILDFWATWCGPCRAEIPDLIDLQKKYQKQGLAVVGISIDEDGAKAVKPFINKAGVNYTVLLGDDKVREAFGGIDAIPVTFVIDRHGYIAKKHLGLAGKDDFEADIKPLLTN